MRKNDRKRTNQTSKMQSDSITKKVIQESVVEIKFLAVSWLDDFEKKNFGGKTIDQLLNPQKYD